MAQKKRKSSSKHGKKSTAQSKKQSQAKVKEAQAQSKAVITFAVAIFLAFLVIIPGGSLWGWLHRLVMGLFGWAGYLLPLFVGYMAISAALKNRVRVKTWQVFIGVLLVGSTVQLFIQNAALYPTYTDALSAAFDEGVANRGTGVFGALLGYWAEYLFTDIGAKIVLFLLVFVYMMLITRTSLESLLKVLWKPVDKAKKGVETVVENGAKHRQKKHEIDIELDDEEEDEPEEELDEPEEESAEPEREESSFVEETPIAETIVEPEREVEDEIESPVAQEVKEEPVREYSFPPLSLLNEPKARDDAASSREQSATSDLLVRTLQEFGVSAKVLDVSHGPTVTRYELQPSAGVKISRITGLADDIALRLATTGVRIEAPIPNKAAVGIEVPNRVSGSVGLRELIDTKEFANAESRLTVALGRDIAGKIVLADLAKMPHLLIAGTTGSGKSVCTNAMIQSVLFHARPDEVRLLLIDPKLVEFSIYNGIPHLLVPVVTDPRKAAGALGWAVNEMDRRYKMFSESSVRDIVSYNEAVKDDPTRDHLPQILIIIDELADLMMVAANDVEDNICRLAQKARAAGMHLVIATQRPSVDVITGLIKANVPSRLALTVASAVDSRTIIDTGGAEKLLGKGDMLFMPVGYSKPVRVQGCFVSNHEVEAVVDFLKSRTDKQIYDEAVEQEIIRQAQAAEKSSSKRGDDDDGEAIGDGDPMLPQAVEVVIDAGMASTSLLQRKLRLGYARAGRIVDEMEQRGIVGPHEGSKPRQVLITRQQWLEMNMTRADDDAE